MKHFSHDLKGVFTIFNFGTIFDPKLRETVRKEIVAGIQGDVVANIKIQDQTTFIDGLMPIALGVVGALVAPPRI